MVRAYVNADLEELMAAWESANALAHPFLSEKFVDQVRHDIPALYIPNAETWVYELDGSVVGFIALLGNEVGAIFVDPRYHGTGAGRALMDKAQALRGTLEVEVFKENAIGRAFYEKYGFKLMHEGVHEPTGCEILRLSL
jgi:putative acetyltransferase